MTDYFINIHKDKKELINISELDIDVKLSKFNTLRISKIIILRI